MQIFKMPTLKVLVSRKQFYEPITDTNKEVKPPPPPKYPYPSHQSKLTSTKLIF